MKLLFFGDDFRLGVLNGQSQVVDVSDVVKDIPHLNRGPDPRRDREFRSLQGRAAERRELGSGQAGRQPAHSAAVPHPSNIICMAVNYMEDGDPRGASTDQRIAKSPNSVIGQGDTRC